MTTALSVRRLYTYHGHQRRDLEWALVCHAEMNASRLAVVVLESTETSKMIVVPWDEFELNYRPKANGRLRHP